MRRALQFVLDRKTSDLLELLFQEGLVFVQEHFSEFVVLPV